MKRLFSLPDRPKRNLGKVFVAIIGMTIPIIVGVWVGKPEIGVFAAFGGLALSGEGGAKNFQQYLQALSCALIAGMLAFAIGGLLSSASPLGLFLLPPIIFLVSLLGGISRTLARYTTLFLLFLIIAASIGSTQVSIAVSVFIFCLGAVWTLLVAVVFWPIRKYEFEPEKDAAAKQYSLGQLYVHWKKSLKTITGWQYSLRITACAIIAVILIAIIPMPHIFWILLTTGILVQRNIEQVPIRMLQRGTGTCLGVVLLGSLTLVVPSTAISVSLIFAFSGLRVYFRENNYLLYSVVMTALVVILLDFGKALSYSVILERLVATGIGCAVSFIFGYLFWFRLLRSSIK